MTTRHLHRLAAPRSPSEDVGARPETQCSVGSVDRELEVHAVTSVTGRVPLELDLGLILRDAPAINRAGTDIQEQGSPARCISAADELYGVVASVEVRPISMMSCLPADLKVLTTVSLMVTSIT